MFELFVVGTFWFWVLLVVTLGFITGFVNRKDSDGSLATLFLVVALGLFFFLGNKDSFFSLGNFIKNKPLEFLLYVGTYLLTGAIWSIVKWYYFLVDYKNDYIERKSNNPRASLNIPIAKDYKGDIIMWMSYWPVSLFWTLINQYVHKIWTNMFSNLENLYNKISNHIFKDLIKKDDDK